MARGGRCRQAFDFPDPVYPIADAAAGRDMVALAAAILAGGARLIQLRAKEASTGELVALARAVKALADRSGARLVIDDRADVAHLVGAAGVHLGQDDLPVADARALLGSEALIGLSTHSLEQIDAALVAGGIDYLAFGPIYPTANKANPDPVQGLDALRRARVRCPLPLVAIGGIGLQALPAVLAAGANAAAVIGAVAGAPDPEQAMRDLLAAARARGA